MSRLLRRAGCLLFRTTIATTSHGAHFRLLLQLRLTLKPPALFTLIAVPVVGSCLFLLPLASASDFADSSTGISVRDAIEMTRLVDPSARTYPWIDNSIKFSPDGTYFAIATQKGDLERDSIVFRILVFDVEVVRAFVNGNESLDAASLGHPVVTMESKAIKHGPFTPIGISHLLWLTGTKLAFIGQVGASPTQVYSVDVTTQNLTQLTSHDQHIKQFTVSDDLATLVFVAEDAGEDITERTRNGYAVESNSIHGTLLRDPTAHWSRDDAFYSLHLPSEKLTRLTDPGHLLAAWSDTWISPNGRWVIVLANVIDLPAGWLGQYAPLGSVGEINRKYEGNPALAPRNKNVRQYVVVDTTTGETRPLIRAPVSWGRIQVSWSKNSESAIVSNTFLPLDHPGDEELERRRESVSVVEFNVRSGQTSTIVSYPWNSVLGGPIQGIKRLDDDAIVVEYADPDSDRPLPKFYRRSHDDHWILQDDQAAYNTIDAPLSIHIQQDVDTPPDLAVVSEPTGRPKRITDLNPTLRQKIDRRFEHFSWTDKNGRTWEGGLLYPPDYRSDRRYPLVIQTYGYSADEFLIDGPAGITSAFAARPLATRGMIVLQMRFVSSSDPFPLGTPEEGPNYVAAFEGAVATLGERGIVDSQRVGLIGFSRTGLHVSYAITFSEITYAAAIIADSTSAGLLSFMSTFGAQPPGPFSSERIIGAPFWRDDRQIWLDRSPNMNAHRVRTPVRFEAYGRKTFTNYWDMYTLLRRHYRPAEMFHIPQATHVLQRPLARYASQQGAVDWFSFWLTGYEDPDPARSDQYRRWRALRQEHSILETQTTASQR